MDLHGTSFEKGLGASLDAGSRPFLDATLGTDSLLKHSFAERFDDPNAKLIAQYFFAELEAMRDRYERENLDDYKMWKERKVFESDLEAMIRARLDSLAEPAGMRTLLVMLDALLEDIEIESERTFGGYGMVEVRLYCEYLDRALSQIPAESIPACFAVAAAISDEQHRMHRSSHRGGYLRGKVAEGIDSVLVDLYADDPAMAGVVCNWASMRMRKAWEAEQCQWVRVQLRAMHALGESADSLERAAEPQVFGDLETRLFLVEILEEMGELERARTWLEHVARPCYFPRRKLHNDAEARLLHLYNVMGLREDERNYLKELLDYPWTNDLLPAGELFRRYKAFWSDEEWPSVRDELFACMSRSADSNIKDYQKIGVKLCDCLVEECLDGQLLEVIESLNVDFERYESFLLESGHSDFLVSRWTDIVEERRAKAEKKGTQYDRLGEALAHLASLPGGEKPARKMANELRSEYPKRPALHRELEKAGL